MSATYDGPRAQKGPQKQSTFRSAGDGVIPPERARPFGQLGQRHHRIIQLGVRQCSVCIAVEFGQVAGNIVGTEQHLQGPPSSDRPRQAGHRPAAGRHVDAHFPLRQDGLFPAQETDIAGKREFAAVAAN